MPPSLLEQFASTPLSASNASYVEALYEQYLRDPAAIDATWRSFFDALPPVPDPERAHGPVLAINPWLADDDFYLALARRSGGPVLDLGCGTGRLARALQCNVIAARRGNDTKPPFN